MIDQNIVCPHCYAEYEPTFEDTWIGDEIVDCYTGDIQIVKCDKCGKKFSIVGFEAWMYETEEVDSDGEN